jgi:hypothetical protein
MRCNWKHRWISTVSHGNGKQVFDWIAQIR